MRYAEFMRLGKRFRTLLKVVAIVLAVFAALWLTIPFWFPFALRPLAGAQGLQYARYDREGYSHFSLEQISFRNEALTFRANRVQLPTPNRWLLGYVLHTPPTGRPVVRIDGWRCELASRPQAGGATAASIPKAFRSTVDQLSKINRWIPTALLSYGTFRVETNEFLFPSILWSNRNLSAQIEWPARRLQGRLEALLGQSFPTELRLQSDSLHLETVLFVSTNASGLVIQGTNFWWGNSIEVRAQFGPKGLLPETAILSGAQLRIPQNMLALPGYEEIAGSAAARWDQGKIAFDLSARALPPGRLTNRPPVDLELHAHGDTNSFLVDRGYFTAPWLKAALTREVDVQFAPPFLRKPVLLKVDADLARQPWLPVQGGLNGEVELFPVAATFPKVQFHLAGQNVGTAELRATRFQLAGSCEWPWLKVETANAEFDDGSRASAQAQFNVEEKLVTDGRVDLRGPLANRWLPRGCAYQSLVISAKVSGSATNFTHQGHLKAIGVTFPSVRPAELQLDWSGQNRNVRQLASTIEAGSSAVALEGGLTLNPTGFDLQLAKLAVLTNRQPALQLTHPCELSLQRPDSNQPWKVSLGSLDLNGPDGQLHARAYFRWPGEGTWELAGQDLPSTLLQSFCQEQLPQIELRNLTASAGWSNGPAVYRLSVAVQGKFPEGIAGAELQLAGDAAGLVLSNLVVSSSTTSVAVAHGFLPLMLNPAAGSLLALDNKKPFELSAAIQPHAFVWDRLATWTGVALKNPRLELKISGTCEAPQGDLELSAQRIQISRTNLTLPSLENLRLACRFERQRARLTDGYVLVQRQPLILTGELPLDQDFWTEWKRKRIPSWEKATAQLRMEDVELAAFEPLYPKLLTAQGIMNADLALLPGGKLGGAVTIEHARTRALATLGPIRDINLQLRFLDRTARLESATARISSSPVVLSGKVDLQGTNWLRGETPPFRIHLRGSDVPLARQPEFIIRSDLDLTATKTNGASPVISGVAHLRDSYYLSDLKALLPGKVAAPAQRPPYFSITDPALADWRLGITLDGVRFLKVRSPLFNGELSSSLKLQGTLQDPIALGDLKIDSGLVVFPFASLQVNQGLVMLSSQDPYNPQLSLTAASKQFGYDLRMEVTGPADAPIIQFSSTPPLSSEQILLMVTAGQLPQGSYTLSAQQRAQTVAFFFGRDLLAKLGFGDQTEQRLTIHSGEEISEQGRPTYNVEYKLSNRWSITGEYDRFGDYNAGFKWRIYSR
jgi:translocation and assembly module TamB